MIPYSMIGSRIKEYFSEIGMSQQEAASVLGVQQAAVSNQLNGRPFGKNSAAKWNKAFGFRKIWLMTGEGPMFDTQANKIREYDLEDHPELNHDNDIPVIPARLFRAPEIDIYEYVSQSPSVEKLPPVPHFQKHDMFATCPGDAMAPRIRRGYLMALRRVPKDTVIINGDIYAVDTKSSGMFIRRLISNESSLTCVSENPEVFPTFEIENDDVITIFRVVGILINM
ncbi:MAG: helix-turn-helix transcriptional regulator [Bacteroidales bacterium]|nr:helix-turn-helix transcriptional regulator [Bacteroidales bacterium]